MMQQNFVNPNASYSVVQPGMQQMQPMQYGMQQPMMQMQQQPMMQMQQPMMQMQQPMPMQMQQPMQMQMQPSGPMTIQQAVPAGNTFGGGIQQFGFANGGGLDQQQDGVSNAVNFKDVFMNKEVGVVAQDIIARLDGFADQFHAKLEEKDKLYENIYRSLPSAQTTIVKTIKAIDVNTQTRVALKLDIAIKSSEQPTTTEDKYMQTAQKSCCCGCTCCACCVTPAVYGTRVMLVKTEIQAVLAKINEGAKVNDNDAANERAI
eukprot:Opistho-2@63436